MMMKIMDPNRTPKLEFEATAWRVVPLYVYELNVSLNSFQPSRYSSAGWWCHSAPAVPTTTRISARINVFRSTFICCVATARAVVRNNPKVLSSCYPE